MDILVTGLRTSLTSGGGLAQLLIFILWLSLAHLIFSSLTARSSTRCGICVELKHLTIGLALSSWHFVAVPLTHGRQELISANRKFGHYLSNYGDIGPEYSSAMCHNCNSMYWFGYMPRLYFHHICFHCPRLISVVNQSQAALKNIRWVKM